MGKAEPFLLTVVFGAFALAYGALPWLAGGLYLDTHEGDSYHLLDILTRMERGDVPHLDFVTPLGALAFWPIHWLIQAGHSAGAALILAQLSVAGCLLPVVAYAATTRLPFGLALFFGCTTLGLVLALSYGTATSGVGISMHYNRWAWAISFTLLLLALVPARTRNWPIVDGLLIGVLAAALLLLKVTYFVTMMPVAALALWQMHRMYGVFAALLSGVAIVLVATITCGLSFWIAYIADLRLVASNEIRPFVGTTFDQIVAGPTYINATLLGVITALIVRRTAPQMTGLAILLMIPGFLYITYQNFGNDPQWLLFLPVLLLALRSEVGANQLFGMDLRWVSTITAVTAFAVFFPSFFNIAMSPVKHFSLDKARFLPMLPTDAGHQDIFIRRDRAYMMTAQVFRDQEPGPWAKYEAEVGRAPIPEFEGVSFPYCEWMAGSRALFETLGADLAASGIPEGSRLFTADLVAAYWFFAPVAPPEGSAPWYYGGLSGLRDTDYVMVPKCAFTTHVRNVVLRELSASGIRFTLVRDNDLLALFKVEAD